MAVLERIFSSGANLRFDLLGAGIIFGLASVNRGIRHNDRLWATPNTRWQKRAFGLLN